MLPPSQMPHPYPSRQAGYPEVLCRYLPSLKGAGVPPPPPPPPPPHHRRHHHHHYHTTATNHHMVPEVYWPRGGPVPRLAVSDSQWFMIECRRFLGALALCSARHLERRPCFTPPSQRARACPGASDTALRVRKSQDVRHAWVQPNESSRGLPFVRAVAGQERTAAHSQEV